MSNNNMTFNFKGAPSEVADQIASLEELMLMVVTNYSHETNWYISISGSLNGENTGLRSTLFNSLVSLVKQIREEDDLDYDDDDFQIDIFIEPVEKTEE